MNKNKLLLVVNTEVGLLVALLYFYKYFEKTHDPIFILLRVSSHRFKNINFGLLPGKACLFKNELTANKLFPNRDFLSVLSYDDVAGVVIQNPLDFASQIIINFYKKQDENLFTAMSSDGLLLERGIGRLDFIRLGIMILYRKFINDFKSLPNKIKLYHSMIDEVEDFIAHKNIGAKNFIDSSRLIQENFFLHENLIKKIFHFKIRNFQNCSVIVFTQPLLSQTYLTNTEKEKYIKLLENIFDLLNKNEIRTIIKMHPGDKKSDYIGFESQYVKIDEQNNLPAEIILSSVSNKIVISMFSSVSLYNTNSTNKHYWMNKLMDYDINKLNKKPHINIPNTFDEFEKELIQFIKVVQNEKSS